MNKKTTFILSASIILILALFLFKKDYALSWATNDIRKVIENRPDFHLDTIFVLTNKEPGDKFFQSRISKFSDKEIEDFFVHLYEKSDIVILKTKNFDTFDLERPNWLDNNNGILTVLVTYYPFFRIVETTVLAGDGSFFTESRHYWFFRWRKIGLSVGVS